VATQSLIPSFEKKELHSIDAVASEVFKTLNDEIEVFKDLANPETCKVKYLPYLAYSFKVDLWDDKLRETEKRALIKDSLKLHRLKGTRWAILEILKAIGFSIPGYEAEIIEYKDKDKYIYNVKRDGSHSYDSSVKHNDGLYIYDFGLTNWAEYAVLIKVPISQSQVKIAKDLINKYAPVRCVLKGFVSELKQRDGTIFYDSTYTH